MDTNVALRNRTGFDHRGMRVLYGLVYPFCHCKGEVPPEIRQHEDPIIFVCNHYEIFGPLALMTSLKARFRVWCNEGLLEMEENVDKLVDGAVVMAPVFSKRIMEKILHWISPLIDWVFAKLRAIPVSRSETTKLLHTMRQSVQAMEMGESLVIFPEKGEPHYALGGVTPFFPGFAMVGEFVSRKWKRPVSFCPLHIDQKGRKLRFGPLVQYIPGTGDPKEESQRVSDVLYEHMQNLALEAGYQPMAALPQE
ncbi:MAG: 1-acyl-sn-glycerol-3-phosphate acyltransferase [Clostridia bacterium]|nr:1-acyl-sn-glycerol-3-phosphate acyltransferase [Clostridia bacterium]MBP3649018.1 1-acyl-sn-glycerol-3-phosphate acyltransferase [Clostridia bacterium]